MKITARKAFESPVTGDVKQGQVIDTEHKVAARLIANGYCEPYRAKVMSPQPVPDAQAEEEEKPKPKRGRPRKKADDE